MKEIFVPIHGSERLFEVSNLGSLKVYNCKNNYKPEIRLPKSHISYQTFYPKKGKSKLLHVAVLETFVGPRPKGCFACHYDDNRRNNRLDNLRWDTASGNHKDRVRNLNEKLNSFSLNPKLTKKEIQRINFFYKKRRSSKKWLCEVFKINPATIDNYLTKTKKKELF